MALLPLPVTLAAILSLLCIPFICAVPLNCTSTPTLDISYPPSSSSHTRTLFDIIQSCAATLLACSWAAIHPNIPGMDEGRMTIFFRRLSIMVMALIAPELMVTWATMQFLSARDAAKTFNAFFNAQLHQAHKIHSESTATLLSEISTSGRTSSPHLSPPHVASRACPEWTVTHGFFAWMGGFMLYFNDKPRAPLTPTELQRFVDEGSVEMPVIMEEELDAVSKSDAFSKGIAILQLAWFVLQLVARYIQNLPTTLLEIDTLAVVALACISYGLWWTKPKDVRRPRPVYWKEHDKSPPAELTYEKSNTEFSLNGWHHYLLLVIYPLRSLMGTRVTISPRAVRERRIPALGGYDDSNPHDNNHVITLFVGCFSAFISGGVHCFGWYYLFQGHTEQILWRATSLVTASASLPLLLIFGWVILFDFDEDSWVVRWSVATIAFIYIATRLTVIVLIVFSLQSLPAGTYDVVAWTTFVPHV
ncbi:hypothetical protein CY34DRAFT_811684 [Suillus luteus UH-Slu-Lm8-n1]|uniref:Uncharacterized protein n=1 Tax=Suillus luteus UH-Slu-Lm8-n1 TaxID=930992 RepID=A0A0D0AVW4_9AGAM|nr:hypothetical protein CY34DRAFT_811684 [Suillus luteus UH-Slu-Lm8-n1]